MPTSMPLLIPTPSTFDLIRTVRFMRFTEAEVVDTLDGARYRRLFHLPTANASNSRLHIVSVEKQVNDSSLALHFAPKADAQSQAYAAALVRDMFSLEHDLRSFRRLTRSDSVLNSIERAHRGLHLPRWASLFEALTISILSQQISTAVAYVLKRRLVERFGEHMPLGDGVFYAFPLPARVAEAEHDELRALGLSNAKAHSILELARRLTAEPSFAAELAREDNETIINRLSLLRGIGRWTAEWALMLYFGRTDVFPAGDLALRAVMSNYYLGGEQMPEREMRDRALARWGAWASYVCIYILAGLRSGEITMKPRSDAHVVSST